MGREIHVTLASDELDGCTFLLNKQDRFYVFTIDGFPTEDAAKRYINNVWAGLIWVLLHYDLQLYTVFELGKVIYPDDPYQAARNYGFKEPIDAFLDGGQPAVYPTEKRICIETAQPITPLQTYEVGDVLMYFREGVTFPASAEVINDVKLKLAFELYRAYFTELSPNARFLALVMALEALAPGRSQSVETLVRNTLQANGDKDAEAMANKATEVYRHRGRLLHFGQLKPQVLSQATSDAKNIVERVLKVRFCQKAAPGRISKGLTTV